MPRKQTTLDPVVGARIRELCGERLLSIAELARRSGLSPGVLRRIVGATRPVEPAERRSIARALGVKAQDLVRAKIVDPDLAAAVLARPKLERERDDLRKEVEELRKALAAAQVAREAALAEARALKLPARADDVQEFAVLHARADALRQDLTAERAARRAEVAELRDQHLREVAAMRSNLYEEHVKALGEAQDREVKLSEALSIALDENERLARAASGGPPSHRGPPPGATASPASTSESRSSLAEKLAVVMGLSGVALGTWLLSSKRT